MKATKKKLIGSIPWMIYLTAETPEEQEMVSLFYEGKAGVGFVEPDVFNRTVEESLKTKDSLDKTTLPEHIKDKMRQNQAHKASVQEVHETDGEYNYTYKPLPALDDPDYFKKNDGKSNDDLKNNQK